MGEQHRSNCFEEGNEGENKAADTSDLQIGSRTEFS